MSLDTVVPVVVDAPQHAGLNATLDYQGQQALSPGTLVQVPLGQRSVPGIVWHRRLGTAADAAQLRPVQAVLHSLSPLGPAWMQLVEFCAAYYQRSVGEVALSVLPPELRKLDDVRLAKRLARLPRLHSAPTAELTAALAASAPHAPSRDRAAATASTADAARAAGTDVALVPSALPQLTEEQAAALDLLSALPGPDTLPTLLQGVTGSGKTEVYLRSAARALAAGRQVLVLVPEINLTPQLEARFAERFAGQKMVTLHSGLTPAQRLRHWLLAHLGQARSGAGHAAGGVCLAAAAGPDRRRRRARPVLQAAGRRALLGARPGGVPRPARRRAGAAGLGHALARKLARMPSAAATGACAWRSASAAAPCPRCACST